MKLVTEFEPPVLTRTLSASLLRLAEPAEVTVRAARECSLYLAVSGCVTLREGDARLHLGSGDVAVVRGLSERTLAPLSSPAHGALLLCAVFRSTEAERSALATSVHLPAPVVDREPAVHPLVALLRAELENETPFQSRIVPNLLEALWAAVERTRSPESGAPGQRARPLDPPIARAVELILKRPAERWTVAALGKAVGLSRAAFARRFLAAVGAPPLRYLAERRLELAAALLAGTDAAVADVARQAGYLSEFAFSRAFKRHAGEAPAFYRQRVRAGRVRVASGVRPALALAA